MSDVWAPPDSAQQYPAQPSTGVDVLLNRIRTLEGIIAEVVKGSPLRQAGMGVSPGQIDFDGNVVINGTLSLPAGIIDNAALANPLTFADAEGDADGFAIPTAMTTVATAEIVVPAGFTRALVIASGAAVGFNGTANKIGINARVFIRAPAETHGRLLTADTSSENRLVALSPMKQELLSGLTAGQKVYCDIRMSAATALAAAGFNGASINAYGILQR